MPPSIDFGKFSGNVTNMLDTIKSRIQNTISAAQSGKRISEVAPGNIASRASESTTGNIINLSESGGVKLNQENNINSQLPAPDNSELALSSQNILTQSGTAALMQAQQSSQSILRLLG